MRNASEAKVEFERAFGPVANLTPAQVWFLIKWGKQVRLRARNNSAFNNLLNGMFGSKYSFNQENKTRPKRYGAPGEMENYPGLVVRDAKTREKVGSQSDANEEE